MENAKNPLLNLPPMAGEKGGWRFLVKKVLIVEDERDIVDVLKTALENEGFEVSSALDGGEGLEKIRSFKPDVILLDIMMEGMDGVTMKKKMKDDIPIIIISACDGCVRESVEKEMNVYSWLEKPFNIDELIAEINKVKK